MARQTSFKPKDYDERVYRKGPQGMSFPKLGLILIALVAVVSYFAVTKEVPFQGKYEVKAVFDNAANIRARSPVRIAGVDVGEVRSVRSVGEAAEVTFTVDDAGRPIHEDATVRIRPRIFLEGNFFMDVHPGSPSSPELDDGGTLPVAQTSTAVQLDEILTSLQGPSRENLKALLEGYGTGLNRVPTARDDLGMDPDIQGETGAEAINDSFQYGGPAGRDTAIVAEALQGTQPHDLSGLIAAQADVFQALIGAEQQLKDLVTNFNTTARAFASESGNLRETVRLLAPTLERAEPSLRNTDNVLPFLRAFARDITPGLKQLPSTIAVSGPWLSQTRRLLKPNELGFIADELRRAAPGAGIAASDGIRLFTQIDLLSRCADQVLLPTGDPVINDAFSTGVPNYKDFGYAVTNFAGETQNFDGNGPYLRLQAGGGPVRVRAANPGGGPQNEFLFADSIAPPAGTQPVVAAVNKPPFRTDVPCHTSPVPDINGPAAAVGPPNPEAVP